MSTVQKVIFSWLVGFLYCLFGTLQILSAIVPGLSGILSHYLIPSDIVSGFVLWVIGAVFIVGAQEMHAKIAGESLPVCRYAPFHSLWLYHAARSRGRGY